MGYLKIFSLFVEINGNTYLLHIFWGKDALMWQPGVEHRVWNWHFFQRAVSFN